MPKMMRALPSYVTATFSVAPMTNPRSGRAAAVAPASPTRLVALKTLTVICAGGHGQRAGRGARVRVLRTRSGWAPVAKSRAKHGQVQAAGEDRRGTEPGERESGEQHAEDDGLPLVHVPSTQLPGRGPARVT